MALTLPARFLPRVIQAVNPPEGLARPTTLLNSLASIFHRYVATVSGSQTTVLKFTEEGARDGIDHLDHTLFERLSHAAVPAALLGATAYLVSVKIALIAVVVLATVTAAAIRYIAQTEQHSLLRAELGQRNAHDVMAGVLDSADITEETVIAPMIETLGEHALNRNATEFNVVMQKIVKQVRGGWTKLVAFACSGETAALENNGAQWVRHQVAPYLVECITGVDSAERVAGQVSEAAIGSSELLSKLLTRLFVGGQIVGTWTGSTKMPVDWVATFCTHFNKGNDVAFAALMAGLSARFTVPQILKYLRSADLVASADGGNIDLATLLHMRPSIPDGEFDLVKAFEESIVAKIRALSAEDQVKEAATEAPLEAGIDEAAAPAAPEVIPFSSELAEMFRSLTGAEQKLFLTHAAKVQPEFVFYIWENGTSTEKALVLTSLKPGHVDAGLFQKLSSANTPVVNAALASVVTDELLEELTEAFTAQLFVQLGVAGLYPEALRSRTLALIKNDEAAVALKEGLNGPSEAVAGQLLAKLMHLQADGLSTLGLAGGQEVIEKLYSLLPAALKAKSHGLTANVDQSVRWFEQILQSLYAADLTPFGGDSAWALEAFLGKLDISQQDIVWATVTAEFEEGTTDQLAEMRRAVKAKIEERVAGGMPWSQRGLTGIFSTTHE